MGVDDTDRQFDAAGNVTVGTQVVENTDPYTLISTRVRAVNSRSYYDADERLRVFQQYDTDYSGNKGSGVWEEYRYDPLGRRVLVRTRRENPLCYGDLKTCISSVTRFVWSGDQILWELKDASDSYAADAGGRVSYVHAGGIDRPLAIWKQGVGTIVTHQNWRGQFAMGTFTSGAPSDCQQYPPSGCVPVSWPGWSTTAWHEKAGTAPTTGYEHYWMGSLAVGMRDASGQMYMRNRYYDPATGQFTQPDPIGLSGGLNAYGFAAGDPVSYSDPYGLCAEDGEDHSDSTRTVTPREESRLRCIAQNYLSPEVRGQALAMLDAKQVGVGDYKLGAVDAYQRGSSIFFTGGGGFNSIAVFNEYALARIFAHEIRHVNQSRWVNHSGQMSDALVGIREMDARDFEGRVLIQPDLPRFGWDGVERCEY
ncbi:MAG TPA: RHS repeat-associated core domain-containing protein [Longimicrobium sp.]|uniref:RHS repeat-associated core domain-containing protein n=1 Tax=Longimicrobium sp. TaxID=2029185 RepID=UPI002ED9F425